MISSRDVVRIAQSAVAVWKRFVVGDAIVGGR